MLRKYGKTFPSKFYAKKKNRFKKIYENRKINLITLVLLR